MRLESIRVFALLAISLASTASAAVDCSKPIGDLDISHKLLEGTEVHGGAIYWHGLAGDRGPSVSSSVAIGGTISMAVTS